MENSDRILELQQAIVDYIPALVSFSRRFYTNPVDAEDLVQETIARALSNLDKYEDGTRLKSWLFTIMRNTFCSRFAVSKRESPGQNECVSDLRSVPPSQEWTIRVKEVDMAVHRLPACYRQVLEGIVLEGRTYEEVASQLGCAVGTVKSRLNRARSRLTERFGSLDE